MIYHTVCNNKEEVSEGSKVFPTEPPPWRPVLARVDTERKLRKVGVVIHKKRQLHTCINIQSSDADNFTRLRSGTENQNGGLVYIITNQVYIIYTYMYLVCDRYMYVHFRYLLPKNGLLLLKYGYHSQKNCTSVLLLCLWC